MHDSFLAFCKWLENTWWGTDVRSSLWVYPFIQLIHFTGLSVWLGTNAAVDMRLLGLGKQRQTAAQLSDALFAWNWIGFCIVVLGGFLLFSATASTYIANPAFQVKLGMLVPTALIWHILVQRKARDWGKTDETSIGGKLARLAELLLWI